MKAVIEIAGIPIEVEYRYGVLTYTLKDYLSEKEPLFTVAADDKDLEYEASKSDIALSRGDLESVAVFRKIAEKLVEYDAFVFHGSVINFDGRAYLFTAKSGVGKTTHTRLWLSEFKGRARVLNGDKPVIRVIDSAVYASGTPWRGKEQYGEPGVLPLAGIAFLERAKENEAYPENPDAAITRFATQAHIPKSDAAAGIKMLRLFNKVLMSVPLITLKCNMEPSAAHTAYEAFRLASKDKKET